MSGTEQIVAGIWEELLKCDPSPGPESDFFELGGDSLQMMSMLIAVNEKTGVEISPGDFYDNSTLRAFSALVDSSRA